MVKKIISNLGYIGLTALLVGSFYYSVNRIWDWRTATAVYAGGALVLIYLVANFAEFKWGLQGRVVRQGGAALATLILGLGVLVLLNFLNVRHHKRLDLTEAQSNALSEQTRKVAEGLDREIQIVGFFEDEARGLSFQNLVKEYNFLNSDISYEIVDPQQNPGRAQQFEASPTQRVFVLSGDRREILDDFSEERITNAIIKVTRDTQKAVYFLEGHGERDLSDTAAEGFSIARDEIVKQNYQVQSYNLAQENQVPPDAAVLVAAAPQINFFANEEALLTEYLAAGGKLLLLVDPQTSFDMNEFLTSYGIRVEDNVVIDATGLGQLMNLGAAAPLVGEYPSHPISEDLTTMSFFPMARAVSSDTSTLGYQTTELLQTSSRSWGETELEGNEVSFEEDKDQPGPLSLGVAASLKIEKEQVEQSDTDSAPSPAAGGDADSDETAAESAEQQVESRLVVVGDSDFATNAYFDRTRSANGDLLLNMVSWLAEDTDLISVRPKDPTSRTITLTASQERLTFWASVVLFPLATFVFGISVWYRRR